MYILRAFTFLLFLARVVLAEQPTPILPDPKLTPGDTFDVTAQDVCVPGYAKKVRAVPGWLKRQAYAEYGITQYKTGPSTNSACVPWPTDSEPTGLSPGLIGTCKTPMRDGSPGCGTRSSRPTESYQSLPKPTSDSLRETKRKEGVWLQRSKEWS